jgi:hypothetical protein
MLKRPVLFTVPPVCCRVVAPRFNVPAFANVPVLDNAILAGVVLPLSVRVPLLTV